MKLLLQRRTMAQIAWLALCAVLLRALVPTGFMLDQDSAGHSRMVFCHGVEIPVSDHAADASSPAKKSEHAQLCAFAPSAAPAALHAVPALAIATHAPTALQFVSEGRLSSESRVLRAQSSRGPPVLS